MNSTYEFINLASDEKYLSQMDKEERLNLIYSELDGMIEFYLFKRFKEKDRLNKLFDIFEQPKFIKSLWKIVKDCKEEYAPDAAVCLIITGLISARGNKLSDDVIDKYRKITKRLLESSIKKLTKSTCLREHEAIAIISTQPSKSIIKKGKYVGRYVQSLERELYNLANRFDEDDDSYIGYNTEEFTDKTLKLIIKTLFNKEFKRDILLSIALDKKTIINDFTERQLSVWNVFTHYLLTELCKLDKEEIEKLLMDYVKERNTDAKENRDCARRVNFQQLPEEDYKTVRKVVDKMIKKDKMAICKKFL